MKTLDETDVTTIQASEALHDDDVQEAATEQTAAGGDNPAPDDALPPDVEALIAEAEQRGYLRGRNEAIEVEMRRLSQWENRRNPDDDERNVSQPLILNHLRRSVWD